MATQRLERSEWKPYFDTVSKILVGKQAEIQYRRSPARRPGRAGVVLDPKDDLFEVVIEDDVDHLIYHPKEITWTRRA